MNFGGSYVFDVPSENHKKPIHIGMNVTVYPKMKHEGLILPPIWSVSHSALLFPLNQIYPFNPIVLNGSQFQFNCQSAQPKFMSSNKNIATISQSGLVETHKGGKAVIKCNSKIKTTITVVELKSVSLKKVNHFIYKIENNFSPKLSKNSKFNYNFSYRCTWDAIECGKVHHIFENGSHYCILDRFRNYLCPEHSILTVFAESTKYGIFLKGSASVYMKKSFFMVDSLTCIKIPPNLEFFEFDLKIKKDCLSKNIGYELPPHVNITFVNNSSKVQFQILDGFKGGDVIFEHRNIPRERVKIHLIKSDKFIIYSQNEIWDKKYVICSITIAVVGGAIAWAYAIFSK